MHVWVALRHTGPAAEDVQSSFVTQTTHVFVVVSHNGVVSPAQSVFATHCTHVCVVGSHTGAAMRQSLPLTRHPTQAPEVVSQIGVAEPGTQRWPPSTVHDA